ncbi:putative nuclease HARBI1 [Amphibalanus amphitrite]|uniref:Putative nuclease HARBI1 n=1 Tax=Amphibalanus amphitrite TaxID=1232801 RepID=A0A6A4WAK2_AMPAM|nr:putative nuclease HARBI1 [Amphibalanus amphitrite]
MQMQDIKLLCMLFLQRLPQATRATLSLLAEDTPLDQLATAADRWLQELRDATTAELQAMLDHLQLYRDLQRFQAVDQPVADAALAVLRRHTAYLKPQTVVLSLASGTATADQRQALAAALLSQPNTTEPEDVQLCLTNNTQLANLVTDDSWLLFQLLQLTLRPWLEQPMRGARATAELDAVLPASTPREMTLRRRLPNQVGDAVQCGGGDQFRFYATSGFYILVGDGHGPATATVGRVVHRVTRALVAKFAHVIKWPTDPAQIEGLKQTFYEMAGIPDVVDGDTLLTVVTSVSRRRCDGDMAYRERQLNDADIARLLATQSDSEESEYESDVSEDDCLVELQVVPSETPQDGGVPNEDQSDSEPETDPPARGRVWKSLTRRLTVSEKTLAEADLQTLPEAPATYIVRRGGQVAAEWTVEPENVQRRRDRANITRETPGLKGPAAKNVKTEGEAFGLYISQDIMNIILTHTNRKLDDARQIFAEKGSSDEQRKKKYILAPLDETELRAFIGMTVLRGTFDIGVDDLFSAKHGPPLFRAAMGKQRYLALLAHISFDDAATRDDRRRADKFCIMREVFGMFDNNLRRHYTPSDDITIDESLIKYRGRCPFRVYMPQKPGRYGILHRHADVKHGGRTAFCRALAEELMLPQVQRRAKLYQEQGSLNRVTVHAIGSVLERDLMASSTSGAGPSTAGPERGRCRICMEESHGEGFKRRKGAMGKSSRCEGCGQYVCANHSNKVCNSCIE